MSLSRSPSPRRGGGWSTPGLTFSRGSGSGQSSPGVTALVDGSMDGRATSITWASAKSKSEQVNGYPSFQTRGNGFFSRHARKLSASLPRFQLGRPKNFREAEKLGRGRWNTVDGSFKTRLRTLAGRILRRMKFRLALALVVSLGLGLFYLSSLNRAYRRTSFLGGGSKFVIILAANQGGGVMEWKGAKEWAIERDSIKNKKKYAGRWGYDLEIVDMSTKKRYAHEWRESWEKVDTIRNSMNKYPKAEWFWWLDLNTFIMEPSYSLQNHVFNDLASNVYRDINTYNPLNITHPPTESWLNEVERSPVGDNRTDSISIVLTQDCGGFNLGSFFVRRSTWTNRLLDIWWDPVAYEQRHMQWEHKEQDALEYLYASHPWIRSHTAFLPQRKINSFPLAACNEKGEDPSIHYREEDRDFLVSMAGCEWGRDCWGEIYNYRELSNKLNRTRWEKFKDWLTGRYKETDKKQ